MGGVTIWPFEVFSMKCHFRSHRIIDDTLMRIDNICTNCSWSTSLKQTCDWCREATKRLADNSGVCFQFARSKPERPPASPWNFSFLHVSVYVQFEYIYFICLCACLCVARYCPAARHDLKRYSAKSKEVENINIRLHRRSARSGDETAAGPLSHFSVITTSHLAAVKSFAVVQMAANKCPPHAAMLMSFLALCAQPVSLFSRAAGRGRRLLSAPHHWITVLMSPIQRTAREPDSGSI